MRIQIGLTTTARGLAPTPLAMRWKRDGMGWYDGMDRGGLHAREQRNRWELQLDPRPRVTLPPPYLPVAPSATVHPRGIGLDSCEYEFMNPSRASWSSSIAFLSSHLVSFISPILRRGTHGSTNSLCMILCNMTWHSLANSASLTPRPSNSFNNPSCSPIKYAHFALATTYATKFLSCPG